MSTTQNVKPVSNAEVLNAFDNCEKESESLSIALQKSRIELAAAKATLRKLAAVPGIPAALQADARKIGGR